MVICERGCIAQGIIKHGTRFIRKVAGTILDGVTGIFHWHNPSGRTLAMGSTQPLTEMSVSNIRWGVKATGE